MNFLVFLTKDSGKRKDFESGMRRDTQENKPRYDLIDKDFLTSQEGLMEGPGVKVMV